MVETVVAAFVADPAFRHFFPDDASYLASASSFAGWLFDKRVAQDTVWVVDGGDAVAMWEAPRLKGDGGTSPAPAGTPEPELPRDAAARLAAYDSAVHPLLPTTPFWYLGVVATHPDHAGRRLGRLAMEAGLARAQSDRLPAYLETVTATNVAVYQSVGWKVTATVSVEEVDVRIMSHS